MKKLSILASLLIGVFAFSSCESDRDDNPTIDYNGAQQLEMLIPVIGQQTIDLQNSKSFEIKAKSSPNYGFPTAVKYGAQISLDSNFPENATYTLNGTSTSLNYEVLTSDVNKGLLTLRGVENMDGFLDAFTDQERSKGMPLYIRMTAKLVNAQSDDNRTFTTSNSVAINVLPFFVETKEVLPELWALTGGIIADGSWSTSRDQVGKGMMTMYVKADEVYSKSTGLGIIEYVGYFPAGEFKIIAPAGFGNWNYGMCGGNEVDGGHVYRDGGDDPGNIKITTAGHYTLTLNTELHTLKITPYEKDVKVFSKITIPGSHNGWNQVDGNEMTPVTTIAGGENHDWVTEITLSADSEVKFAADGAWDDNWGNAAFPFGIGTQNGANIKALAGKYKVFFNDITGAYFFSEITEE